MVRNHKARNTLIACGLLVGLVGGNFCVHRWLWRDAASRIADAGTRVDGEATSSDTASSRDDENSVDLDLIRSLPRPAPLRESLSREALTARLAERLPDASAEERAAWSESLRDLPLDAVEGILDLRQQLGSLPMKD